MRLFKNRIEAAHELARALEFLKQEDPLILGIPNGGVLLAAVIAETLGAVGPIWCLQLAETDESTDCPSV